MSVMNMGTKHGERSLPSSCYSWNCGKKEVVIHYRTLHNTQQSRPQKNLKIQKQKTFSQWGGAVTISAISIFFVNVFVRGANWKREIDGWLEKVVATTSTREKKILRGFLCHVLFRNHSLGNNNRLQSTVLNNLLDNPSQFSMYIQQYLVFVFINSHFRLPIVTSNEWS